jgi:hypothetical protein
MPEFGNPRIPWIFSMRGIRCVDGFALGLFTSRSESGLASVKPPLVGGAACREDPADFARFAYQDDRAGFSAGVDVFKLSDWFVVL